jgi:hypothetical protein
MEHAVNEENLVKLKAIMNPQSEESDAMTTFDVECLQIIASREAIVSTVENLRSMRIAYEEQKQTFNEVRLILLRQLMDQYLQVNSCDTFMASKYREFMTK